jgi:hypothetical protein
MKVTFGDMPQGRETRPQLIRGLFLGGSTIADHTEKCIRANVWSESELFGRASRACRNEVRDALGELVDGGLPFAGPTTSMKNGKPEWLQRDFWAKEDYFLNCGLYAKRSGADITVHNGLARECSRRFAEAPTLLQICAADEAGGD